MRSSWGLFLLEKEKICIVPIPFACLYRDLAEQFTNCTLMTYLPGFTGQYFEINVVVVIQFS